MVRNNANCGSAVFPVVRDPHPLGEKMEKYGTIL
jgi:hypothetical protein